MRNDGRLHFSDLKNIADSPEIFQHFRNNQREDTDDFVIGRAVHRGWLLDAPLICWPGRRAGNDYKQAVIDNGGDDLLSQTMLVHAEGMLASLRRNRLACEILERMPRREVELKWMRNGIPCAGRLDACNDEEILELKTAKSSRPRAFQWQGKAHMHREQLSWYDVGLGTDASASFPNWRRGFVVAVQKSAPYPVSVHRVSPLAMSQANARVEEMLRLYAECTASGNWPGWGDTIHDWDADIESKDYDEDDD